MTDSFPHASDRRCIAAAMHLFSVALAISLLTGRAEGVEIQGFLEPYRTVDVAAHETGIITSIKARVGDFVKQGEVIAELDDDVHKLLVETAAAKMSARGRLESSKAELKLRKYRLGKLEELVTKGHGRQEEVERAVADVEIAEAQLLDAQDDLLQKKLEHRRLKVQLERRKIRSPLDGAISHNFKEVGEFVAPNEPEIVQIVQLNPLLAKFSMRRSHAKYFELGQLVDVSMPANAQIIQGVVQEISPVIDAESGTVRIRVQLENADGLLDSGQRCRLRMPPMKIPSDDPSEETVLTASISYPNQRGLISRAGAEGR